MLSYELCVKNITMLAEVYEKQLTKPFVNIYYEVLREMSDDNFKQAIRRLLSERVYPTFPKPAEILQFKIEDTEQIDHVAIEAKRLIDLVGAMNESVYQEHIKTGKSFNDLLDSAKFISVEESDIAVLDQIKPHYSHKLLVANINHYQTSKDLLNAFIDAIHFSSKTDYTLENKTINQLKIKR